MVGFVVATAGYPFCLTLTGSLYSKLLGAAGVAQGFWLGLFATSGSVARVLGPLLVTEIYELWGTYVLFLVVTSTLVISMVLTIISWKWLVPVMANQGSPEGGEATKEGHIKEAPAPGKDNGIKPPSRTIVPGGHSPTVMEAVQEEDDLE